MSEQETRNNLKVGFLGAGAMATALARGIIAAGKASPEDVFAYDVAEDAARKFSEETRGAAVESVQELMQRSDVIFLAVKPVHAVDAILSIQEAMGKSMLLVSIAAGVSLAAIESYLCENIRVVRVMPNTPALVCCGASGYCLGTNATPEDEKIVQSFLSAVGIAYRVSEEQIDAVTGLSGSGPAFVYMMIEAMSDGGVAAGLPRQMATRLAAQTVLGAARMVLETGRHPGVLKDMVSSPAGTTIEGIRQLEESGMRSAFIEAVMAAARRSRQMGRKER
ncbi:MAG TPA: pyrroline-5-carboxylate reductase [Verrucomicrobiota bacterium]|jgi:pyrroline-5-carboxylate reductase|nr:pyrroline-5-carboxylate reductase [Verrucomicrobiota bacterium]